MSTNGVTAAAGTNFANEQTLQQMFKDKILFYLATNNILASKDLADANLKINIAYLRKFNTRGISLNKPKISYDVSVNSHQGELASFGKYGFTSNYEYFKNMLVNLKITLFKWGANDEPEDVATIANIIVGDILKLGN